MWTRKPPSYSLLRWNYYRWRQTSNTTFNRLRQQHPIQQKTATTRIQPKEPSKGQQNNRGRKPFKSKPTTSATLYEPWSEEDTDQEMEDQDFH